MKVYICITALSCKIIIITGIIGQYMILTMNGVNKKLAYAKSRTTRFVKITANYREFQAVPEFIPVISMHIHNAIQTNYAHKGIRGGS